MCDGGRTPMCHHIHVEARKQLWSQFSLSLPLYVFQDQTYSTRFARYVSFLLSNATRPPAPISKYKPVFPRCEDWMFCFPVGRGCLFVLDFVIVDSPGPQQTQPRAPCLLKSEA